MFVIDTFSPRVERIEDLKKLVSQHSYRNGQRNGIHCLTVTDGIVGQEVFHWQSKLISLFLFKKKKSVKSSMIHNSNKMLWICFQFYQKTAEHIVQLICDVGNPKKPSSSQMSGY